MKVDNGGGREHTIPVNYPSNSKRDREKPGPVEKKIESVVTGEVVQRKKGWGRRFREDLIGEEGIEGAISTYVTDILVMAFKSLIADTVENFTGAIRDGFQRALFGNVRRPGPETRGPYVNYNRVQYRQPSYGTISQRARARHDFNEVILQTRGEAEEVLDGLRELVDQYGSADVADFYSLVGITPEFTDIGKWGWYDLRTAMVRHVRGGYLVQLPQPQPLD
jgi:hypothetical protein